MDDVISTGGSLKALDALAEQTQCTIVGPVSYTHLAAAINADPDNWTTYNTTLVVQGGKVLEVRRIWVP